MLLHVRSCKGRSLISRTAEAIALKFEIWYSDEDRLVLSRVACKSQLEPTLHVCTCTETVPDLKNGWTDCIQIWYTARDRLVGCRASQLEAHPRSFARAGLNLSLARLPPQKASYCRVS